MNKLRQAFELTSSSEAPVCQLRECALFKLRRSRDPQRNIFLGVPSGDVLTKILPS